MLALKTQCTERTYCLYFIFYFISLDLYMLIFLLLHGAIVTNTIPPWINKVFLILNIELY